MSKKITDKVTWVGKVDWRLTHFHGHELSTYRGTSYNSYLIRDEKNVLIDTCWLPFDKEFLANLREEIDLQDIDAVIMNHNEVDHSGALPALMHAIPDVPIYCTAKGEAIIRGHYNERAKDWNFVNVKTGDTLNIGESTLTFVEAPMLHWPDTMFTYMDGENILFSNDGFGQHYATESLFDERNALDEVLREAEKYYANIIAIYSAQCKAKLAEIEGMNLPISLICPSHGVIWRENIPTILEKYHEWCDSYQTNQITIIYDTMWNSTRLMSEAIAEGILSYDPDVEIKIMNCAEQDKNDVLTEVFRSKAILVGSPTVNYGYTYAVAGTLELIHAAHLQGKKAAAFGSYGWSGNIKDKIAGVLEDAGFEIVDDGIQIQWVPSRAQLKEVRAYGKRFAAALAGEQMTAEEAAEEDTVQKYKCSVCGYVYNPEKGDPDNGIPAGTAFEDLPEDWCCPLCRQPKTKFAAL